MSAQTLYSFSTPRAVAGGLADTNVYVISSRVNESATGTVKPGFGVVRGTSAGKQAKLPVAESTAAQFEGVVQNGMTTQYDLDGAMRIARGDTLACLTMGHIWVVVPEDANIAYGDPVYLITSGTDAGKFTNSKSVTETALTFVLINGKFIGTSDTQSTIAPVAILSHDAAADVSST